MCKLSNEEYLKIVNYRETFEKEFPKYIEAIVSFYGEERRDEIESKLSNITIVPFMEEEYLENIINAIKTNSSKPGEIIEEINDYDLYFDKFKKLKESLEKDEYIKFIIENKDILCEDIRIKLDEAIDKADFINDNKEIKAYFGYKLETFNLEIFSKNADEIVNSDVECYNKKRIKNDRIDFFNRLGINLGNDYNLYLQNEEVKKMWPNVDRVEELIKLRDEHIQNVKNQLLEKEPNYIEIKKLIDDLNLVDKNVGYDFTMYDKGTTCVKPNYVLENGEYKLHPLVFINMNMNDLDLLDHFIIHELNHVIELGDKDKENSKELICGWDKLGDFSLTTENKDSDEIRKYETFNETINELIAQKISEKMIENNLCVFNKKENSKYKSGCGYARTMFIIRDFYNNYEDVIIESRTNYNINIIYDKVGKENFDALNDLFHKFNDKVVGMNFFNLIDQLNANQDTELTRAYYEIIKERDMILSSMKEYSIQNHL